jgi:hypothetical protein
VSGTIFAKPPLAPSLFLGYYELMIQRIMKATFWLKATGAALALIAVLMLAACANGPRNRGGAIAITGGLEAAPQDAPKMMTWAGAKQWCEDLAADGKNDWRLPGDCGCAAIA